MADEWGENGPPTFSMTALIQRELEESMSKEYTISAFKPTDYLDTYGNKWCEVAFIGESEPARWSMKPESTSKYEVGSIVYGHIEDATSKAGKAYNRFKVDQRPDESTGPTSAVKHVDNQESINRAVALRHAAVLYQGVGTEDASEIVLRIADKFYAWLSQTTIEEDIKDLDGIDY